MHGAGTVSTPSGPPPPHAVKVPESAAATVEVQPVFKASAALSAGLTDSDVEEGVDDAPRQRGYKLIVPVRWPFSSVSPPCLDIEVPESNSAGASEGSAGATYSEEPLSTRPGGPDSLAAEDLVYPALLPGSYFFDPYCAQADDRRNYPKIYIGSVTIHNLGVVDGTPIALSGNAMTVFAEHASAAGTVLLYGAVGGVGDDSLTPPADSSCINNQAGGPQQRYFQPSRALISQRVTGKLEWFEVGSLVFGKTGSQHPYGEFYYDCADEPLGLSGISIP